MHFIFTGLYGNITMGWLQKLYEHRFSLAWASVNVVSTRNLDFLPPEWR